MSTFAPDSTSSYSSFPDLRSVEAQQLRLLLEQQYNPPRPSSSFSHSYLATSLPAMNLSDSWYGGNANYLRLPVPSADDDLSSFFTEDALALPSYPFLPFSTSPPSSPTLHPVPTSKRLASFLDPLDPPAKRRRSDGKPTSPSSSAQYPLLSTEVVDGLYAGTIGMSNGVMGGVDDSELGVGPGSLDRLHSLGKVSDKEPGQSPLYAVSSSASVVSSGSFVSAPSLGLSKAFGSPKLPSALSLLPSTSSVTDSPSSAASTQAPLETGGRHEGVRRAKRRLTDKQRRAKIKEGLEQLKVLVALHGNNSSDQASIVNSSVDLVQQLVDERDGLKAAVRRVREERAEQAREQALVADRQRLASLAAAAQASGGQMGEGAGQVGQLLQQLQSMMVAGVLGGRGNAGQAGQAVGGEADGRASGLEQVILSQYFLQTLQLLSKLPRTS